MLCYQLSNLLLYKHALLLSKCPLTADWLLIRPVWNEISSEPLNYDPIPEHIISQTFTLPLPLSVYFCLLSFHLLFLWDALSSMSLLTWPIALSHSCFSSTECNCSGRSDECAFDVEQHRSTGRGGRCVSCRDHTDGAHCERCRENHYRRLDEEPCLPCICNINGKLHRAHCLHNNLKPLIIIHVNIITHHLCSVCYENI